MTLEAHCTDLEDKHHHMDPWGSSNCKNKYIRGSAAEFAGTMDSTAASQLSQLLKAGIGPPLLESDWLVWR